MSYQWYRDGVAISGATSSSYAPAASDPLGTDVNPTLSVTVTYTNGGETESTTVSAGMVAGTVVTGNQDIRLPIPTIRPLR